MPTYEYECTRCPCRFELRRSFSDDTPVSCPDCGGGVQRIFTAVPIIFKGSGFYSTENRGNHGHSSQIGGKDEAKAGKDEAKAGKDEAKAGSVEEST